MKKFLKVVLIAFFSCVVAFEVLFVKEILTLNAEYNSQWEKDAAAYRYAEECFQSGTLYEIEEYTIYDDEGYVSYRDSLLPLYGAPLTTLERSGIVLPNESTPEEEWKYAVAIVQCLPTGLYDRLVCDGWRIVFVDSILEDEDYVVTAGQTVDSERTILIKNGCAEIAVAHEIGHVLLMDYGLRKELNACGYTEWDSKGLGRVYSHVGSQSIYDYACFEEHICNLFYDYLFYPRELEEQAPEVYGCFERVLEHVGEYEEPSIVKEVLCRMVGAA